ncbi:MAG: dephospho-CoA kinase [Desulfitobacterium hafniense]|nr:dephospho-CoA kinase [Desulfitobacterium hafniense]
MFTIGLTGGIGSGKSTVAGWFREAGVPVLDADKTVHWLFREDQELIALLKQEFGPAILTGSGEIDRKVLGKAVFENKDARLRLESIVHPLVLRKMQKDREGLREKGEKVCIWDVPLLIEAHLEAEVDEIWLVWVPEEVQLERVKDRDKLTDEEVSARLKSQMPLIDKCKYSNVIIDNSGKWTQTVSQLNKELERIKSLIVQ